MKMKTLLVGLALVSLSACDHETTVVTRQRDLDQRFFQVETLRLQRDLLETERLKLWTAPAPTYLAPRGYPAPRPRRR
jgi:hypothetical protein